MKKYTQKQIKELKQNPYTFKVDEQRIFFTVEEAKEYYGIKSNGGIIECCKGKKFYKGKWHKVKYAGKLPDGTKLVWKRLRWRHNKKYRVKIHGR